MRNGFHRHIAVMIFTAVEALLYASGAAAFNGTWTTKNASEETPPATCADDTVMTALTCIGPNCDELRGVCTNPPNNMLTHLWTKYRSEEEGSNVCSVGTYVTAIDCRGAMCDDMALQCTLLEGAGHVDCGWQGPFSDELPNNTASCPAGKFIAGVFCVGANCDDLWIKCCKPS